MRRSFAQSLTLFGLSMVLVYPAAGMGLAAGQTNPVPSQYHIYAGNTHSHTAYTWSHGEQYLKPEVQATTGTRKRPRSKVPKPDWQ